MASKFYTKQTGTRIAGKSADNGDTIGYCGAQFSLSNGSSNPFTPKLDLDDGQKPPFPDPLTYGHDLAEIHLISTFFKDHIGGMGSGFHEYGDGIATSQGQLNAHPWLLNGKRALADGLESVSDLSPVQRWLQEGKKTSAWTDIAAISVKELELVSIVKGKMARDRDINCASLNTYASSGLGEYDANMAVR